MGHIAHLRKKKLESEEDLDFVNVLSLFHNHLTLELGKGLNLDHPRMISANVG